MNPLACLFAASGNRVPIELAGLGPADWLVVGVLLGSMIVFGLAAALAMRWAFVNGQFENFQAASHSIFDPDEPVGEVTDRFPGREDRNG